jgi:SAM-dependent methyltransferase
MNCQKILDAGFGKGDFMEDCPEGTDIWGVDVNLYAVKYFNQRGYKVIHTSVLHLPFPNDFFDGVHCANMIVHLNGYEMRTMLHEFSRVMKPGGRLLITTPREDRAWDDPHSVRPYSLQAIRNLLEDTRFVFIDSHSLGSFWGMGLLGSIYPQLSLFLQILIGRFMGLNLVVLAENSKISQKENS